MSELVGWESSYHGMCLRRNIDVIQVDTRLCRNHGWDAHSSSSAFDPRIAGGEHENGAHHWVGGPSGRRALGKVMFGTGSAQVNRPRRYGG